MLIDEYLRIYTYISRLCTFMDEYLAGGLIPVLRQPSRPIADRIRPRERGLHTWDRPTRAPFFYDTGV